MLAALPAWASAARTDSLLLVLDQTLARQASYDNQRLGRIAALTTALHAATASEATRYDLALRIYDEYAVFKYDSAFAYSLRLATLARHLRSPAKLQAARTKLTLTLRSAGLFKDAFDTLKAIKPHQLPPTDKTDFYEIYSIVCI
ncbi:MAG: hypothetical protein EOO56_02410 [Hymenobacter sp.]|nr:MAG: hypothetical protein EOO56_02410 [Hymenobacter sp.]